MDKYKEMPSMVKVPKRSLRRQGGATLKAGLRMRIGSRYSGLKCVRIRLKYKEMHSASQVHELPVLSCQFTN